MLSFSTSLLKGVSKSIMETFWEKYETCLQRFDKFNIVYSLVFTTPDTIWTIFAKLKKQTFLALLMHESCSSQKIPPGTSGQALKSGFLASPTHDILLQKSFHENASMKHFLRHSPTWSVHVCDTLGRLPFPAEPGRRFCTIMRCWASVLHSGGSPVFFFLLVFGI